MATQRRRIPKEVFLSHSARDRDFVSKLANMLRDHGVAVWYSATNIIGAQQWHDEIGAALARCDWFVVVLTPHSVQSRWVKQELLYALSEKRYQYRIVPVLRKTCDHAQLSWTLPNYQWIDFTGDFPTGCRELLRVWGMVYQGPF